MHQKLIDEMSIAEYREMTSNELYDWSPKKIEEWIHTSGGIIGQDEAVKAAAMIVYNHYEGRPSVSLFVGPTGSGKTEIWRVLQREYGSQNIVIVDASTLTAEGWKGNNKLSTVFLTMNSDARRNRVILVLDEADKIIEPVYGSSGTNYSEIIQSQLLRLCDHDMLFFGCGDGSGSGKPLSVDCSNVSVVLLGAFSKLYEQKAMSQKRIGFACGQAGHASEALPEITTEDLIAYGMRAELAFKKVQYERGGLFALNDGLVVRAESCGSQVGKKTFKSSVFSQQQTINALQRTRQLAELGSRFVKDNFCFTGIGYRIVELFGDDFVVFYKPVIRLFGKKQSRKIKRVNERLVKMNAELLKHRHVEINNVVPADKVRVAHKLNKRSRAAAAESAAVFAQCAKLKESAIVAGNLGINEDDMRLIHGKKKRLRTRLLKAAHA